MKGVIGVTSCQFVDRMLVPGKSDPRIDTK